MIDGEHSDTRTQERGTQSVPRFIVVLAAVGTLALVAAVVAVVFTYESPAADGEDSQTSVEATAQPAAPFTDDDGDGLPDEPPVVDEFETATDGPSDAELSAKADDADEAAEVDAAAKGAPLPTLSTMPESTLSLIALPDSFESARFEVTFSPYGWGAGGPEGCCLVITIQDVKKTSGDAADVTPIDGRNLSVWLDPADQEKLASGGEFDGTIEIRRQGNVGALFLTGVSGP